jgi:triacylglycerol lipase
MRIPAHALSKAARAVPRASYVSAKMPSGSTVVATDKGKGKAETQEQSSSTSMAPLPSTISSAIEEALSTPLPAPRLSEDTHFHEPTIPRPPTSHSSTTHIRPHAPRLLSQLTRSTLPSASLTYANNHELFTQPSLYGSRSGSGSGSRGIEGSSYGSRLVYDEPFPDLDPSTGLPLERRRSFDSAGPSRQLQRTITGLLDSPEPPKSSLPFGMSMPSLPSLPLLGGGGVSSGSGSSMSPTISNRRSFSTSSRDQDWSSWTGGWLGGGKKNVDRMMTDEDQADTVEEEVEKHRRKCKYAVAVLLYLVPRTDLVNNSLGTT